MYHHALSLLSRSWDAFVASLGNTSLGFVSPFLVPIAGLLVYALIILSREGWGGVKDHFKRTVTIAAVVAVAAELLVYVPIFAWNVVKAIHADHEGLVAANRALEAKLQAVVDGADRGQNVPVDPIAARMEKNLSLKKRMIRLSAELEDFYNNKEKNAPNPTYYSIDGIDREKQPERWTAEVAKQQEKSRRAYAIYGSETAKLYTSLFRMRVLAICREATDAGLNIDGLDKAEVVDLYGFDRISYRLAALAEKL